MPATTDLTTVVSDLEVLDRFPGVTVRAIVTEVAPTGLSEAAGPLWLEAHARWQGATRGGIRNEPRVQAYRELSRLIDVDPDRQAPSIQALIERGLRNKPVGAWPQINRVVDAVNAVAVSDLVALGVFDADQLAGAVRMTLSRGGEAFQALGTSEPSQVPADRLVLADEARVLSLFAHRDGVHQAVTAQTSRVLLLGCVVPDVPVEAVDAALIRAASILAGYAKV